MKRLLPLLAVLFLFAVPAAALLLLISIVDIH